MIRYLVLDAKKLTVSREIETDIPENIIKGMCEGEFKFTFNLEQDEVMLTIEELKEKLNKLQDSLDTTKFMYTKKVTFAEFRGEN